jgi:holo-[acyl-carrier protein] synthase
LPKASRSSKKRSGLGLDIVEVSRVKAVAGRSKRFLTRIFTTDEIAYCQAKKNPWPHFAVRFAAKEAVWKALGDQSLTLRDISVSRDKLGRPSALVLGKKAPGLDLSLTHSRDYALAVAVSRGK